MTNQSLITTVAALGLLAGCTTPSDTSTSKETVGLYGPSACTQGSIDDERIFIICQDGAATAIDAMQAMNQPVDPKLDIVAIAADYGVSAQGMTGIQAATYSRIVGKTPEQSSVTSQTQTEVITINGRDFRKVDLETEGREPVTLYIET